jgi:hypothetical protein
VRHVIEIAIGDIPPRIDIIGITPVGVIVARWTETDRGFLTPLSITGMEALALRVPMLTAEAAYRRHPW